MGRMVGPVMGAFLLAHLGPTPAFTISASAHLVFAILLAIVRFPRARRRRSGVIPGASGLRYVWADRPPFLMLLAIGVVGFGSDPSITLARRRWPRNSVAARAWSGRCRRCSGAVRRSGLSILAILRSRISSPVTAATGLRLFGVGMAVIAVTPWAAAALAGFAIAGCGFSWA